MYEEGDIIKRAIRDTYDNNTKKVITLIMHFLFSRRGPWFSDAHLPIWVVRVLVRCQDSIHGGRRIRISDPDSGKLLYDKYTQRF